MKTKFAWLGEVIAIVALGFAFAGTSLAQTTSTADVRKFEVISVEGNKLVVRDQNGTHEYTVPDDFRFTVDGKKLAAPELKAGMKGTATVTTKTTITPVAVTEVREGEVLRATATSMTVRMPDGVARRFTQADLGARGIQLVMDGKPIQIRDLRKGDKLTATIITAGPPTVLTEKEVQMVLDEAKSEPAAKPAEATAGAAKTTAAAGQPAAPAAPAQPASPAALTPAAPKPAEAGGLGMSVWLLIAIVIAAVLFFVMRGKKA